MDKNTKFHINPTGRFVVGGRWAMRGLRPQDYCRYIWRVQPARCGAFRARILEGRSFGLLHGAARGEEFWLRGRGAQVEVQLAYAIGVAEPVSSCGHVCTGAIPDGEITDLIPAHSN